MQLPIRNGAGHGLHQRGGRFSNPQTPDRKTGFGKRNRPATAGSPRRERLLYIPVCSGAGRFSGTFNPAIAHHACCGHPQPGDGSFGQCRRERRLLVLVHLCQRQHQRSRPVLQCERRETAEQSEPVLRPFRALRPASAEAACPALCRNPCDTTARAETKRAGIVSGSFP